jgi:phosphomannomutase
VVAGLHGYFSKELKKSKARIIVGYDCRFLSEESAALAACWLKQAGHEVILSTTPVPTPAVSMLVRQRSFDAGIMITASHNPAIYNGIKFKGSYGGSFMEEMVQKVASHVPDEVPNVAPNIYAWLQEQLKTSRHAIQENFGEIYLQGLLAYIKTPSLKGLRFVVDPMHGAGGGFLSRALQKLGAEVVEIRSERNPLFGGMHPEPLDATTKLLQETVVREHAHAGFILDGDADRIGARDEQGEFVDSHRIFSLLLKHLVEHRQGSGKVLKTISTTDMVDALCKAYKLPLQITPVGFKHICKIMIEEKSLMGGEESGGIGFSDYLPERDGALCALLLAEMLAMSQQKSLKGHIEQLMQQVGSHYFKRLDLTTKIGRASMVIESLHRQPPTQLQGKKITHVDKMDGIKLRFEDSWLMFRGSGTEPLLRLYAEAPSQRQADDLIQQAVEYANQLMGG